MTDFAVSARAALTEKGISIRAAARALNYDPAYVSRVLNGRQQPSAKLAQGLDQLSGADGALAALVSPGPWSAITAPHPSWDAGPGSDDDLEALELARRVEASDVGAETLDRLEAAFDGLAVAYQTARPGALLRDVRRHSAYVTKLLDERKTLAEHRRLLVIGGWLSLLGATLHVDLKQGAAATSRLRTAALLARHAEHPEILGWVFETKAWTALTAGNYGRAVELSRAAQDIAPRGSSAEVQSAAQEGRARARLGEKKEAREAIDRVHRLAATLVMRAQPEHHYVYDPRKATSYLATTLSWIGDPAAESAAKEVIGHTATGIAPSEWPRRVVSAHLDLALTLLSLDRLDEATDVANKAILSGRLLPANFWRVLEIVRAVEARQLPEGRDLREAYEDLSPQPT
ncbi:helix-turn-helix domain-containing protein [Streptomyces sp. NPDC004732]|uniref:helix-turn-helix domain-containing protein n=1 Tax=Streptomyces sp. NPDC004732 TaxID=3154290 RepID=UPI0033AD5E9E